MVDLDENFSEEQIEMKYLEMESRLNHMQGSFFDLKRKKINLAKQLADTERAIPITEKQLDELKQEIAEFKTKNKLL